LVGHTAPVRSVGFSPDGGTLATGGLDDTVRLWDVATRRPIGTPLTGHSGSADSVAFSPDGGTLATAGDGIVRLWNVAMPKDLVDEVCKVAGRDLTDKEWTRYAPPGPKFRKVCP
ncbi:WD40 repeat domain-containing protein, partial [Actinomadura sp. KC345]